MASTLALGNASPREWVVDEPSTGAGHFAPIGLLDSQSYSVTLVQVPSEFSAIEVASSVALPGGIWERHSSDAAPLWVGSDDSALATVVSAMLGVAVEPWENVQALAAAIGVEL